MCGGRLGRDINTMEHRITSTCEDVTTAVFCLDCAEDGRDDRRLSVQEAGPHGPEPELVTVKQLISLVCLNIHNQTTYRLFPL